MKNARLAFILLTNLSMFVLFSTSILRAQCFTDSGKHSCFEYTGLEAKIEQNPFGWFSRDFATSMADPTVFADLGNTVNGELFTRVTLVADDPNFVYEPTCANPNMGGQCVGAYTYPNQHYNPYSQNERWVGSVHNIIEVALPVRASSRSFRWTGRVRIESVERPSLRCPAKTVKIQPSYSFSPVTYTTPVGSGTTACEAYENAWNGFDKFVDVTWDSDIQRLVAPIASFWHNDNRWKTGWQTTVNIGNQTGQTVTYTVENHISSGIHGGAHDPVPQCGYLLTPPAACYQANDCEIETSVTLANGQSTSLDAFRFHVSDSVRAGHDAFIFIRSSPVLAGTQPSVRVFPNTSGAVICQ